MKPNILAVLALLFLIASPLVLAAVDFNQPINAQDEATFDQILQPVMKVYNLVKYIATAIAGLILLFAGVTFFTAGSDVGKKEQAKNMIMYVIIGLAVIWAAPLIVGFIVG